MSRIPDLDFVLREYLADDGGSAPDSVLDVVADRIGRQSRRRRWRLHGRPFVNTQWKVAAALAASVTVAVVAWQLLPSTSIPGATPSIPSLAPSAAETPALSAAADLWWLWQPTAEGPGEAVESCGDAPAPPGCAGALAAGVQRSAAFEPTLTFTVPEGWINSQDRSNLYALVPDTSGNRTSFTLIGRPENEIAVRRIDGAAGMCSRPNPLASYAPTAGSLAEIAEWLADWHGIHAGPVPITLNGLEGFQVDTQEEPDWGCETGGLPPSGAIRNRIVVLATPSGERMAIHIRVGPGASDPGKFMPFVAAATPVVASFQFRDAGS